MTTILLAASQPDGAAWLAEQPAPPAVLVVTPHSIDRSRGVTADAILATPAAAACAAYDRMLATALPCIMHLRAHSGA